MVSFSGLADAGPVCVFRCYCGDSLLTFAGVGWLAFSQKFLKTLI